MEPFANWIIIKNWNYIIVIFALIFAITGFNYIRKNKEFGLFLIKIVALAFFMYRMFRLSAGHNWNLGWYGEKEAWRYSIPFELSSMNYLLLPIIILMNFKNKNICVLHFMALFAGIVTLIATLVSPQSFENEGVNTMYESVLSHAILFILPIWCIGAEIVKFHHSDWYRYIIGFIILSIYGVLINKFVYPDPLYQGKQILFLKYNMLPSVMQVTKIPFFDYLIYIIPFLMLIFFSLKYFNKWNDNSLKNQKEKIYKRNILDSIKQEINN